MILAIDAGNTRVKWGLHDGERWLRQGWAAKARTEELAKVWLDLPPLRRAVASNVAGAELEGRLEEALRAITVEPQWLVASAAQCGVRNGYDQPAQLGSDRWAALIGAWHLHGRGCLVANAGTAMTVDALSDDGIFLGGIIIPGMRAMTEALVVKTAAIQPTAGVFRPFPTNTADAVHSGALSALAGAVTALAATLSSRLGREPTCVLSGGDAGLLRPLLGGNTIMVENLVLEGLIRIALA